jgi:hypothetical protein
MRTNSNERVSSVHTYLVGKKDHTQLQPETLRGSFINRLPEALWKVGSLFETMAEISSIGRGDALGKEGAPTSLSKILSTF